MVINSDVSVCSQTVTLRTKSVKNRQNQTQPIRKFTRTLAKLSHQNLPVASPGSFDPLNSPFIKMGATQLYLNDQLVTITADATTIKKLNEDDQYLAEYVNKAAKMGHFSFLFKDHPIKKIVVRRTSASGNNYKPVWYKKGRPSETDIAATAFLLKLRGSEKYFSRFKDGYSVRSKLWEEIASDMKMEGYDVDGAKCSQKFLNLAQGYYKYRQYLDSCSCQDQKMNPPEFYTELHRILGDRKNDGNNSDGDEEWLPKGKKRKRHSASVDEDEDFFRQFLRKNSELKEDRFREICDLMKKRNEMIKDKLKQNGKIIDLLEKLLVKH